MMSVVSVTGFVVGAMGVFSYIFNYSHILNSLLSLELVSVSIYFLMGVLLVQLSGSLFYILYFLVMVVCEGTLGLSLLVMVSFMYGGDQAKGVNSLVC